MRNKKDKLKDGYWRNLLVQATPEDLHSWQNFIAAQGYSSHMLVICEYL
jgi:hypothetical protein